MVKLELIQSENYFKTKKFRIGALTLFAILFLLLGRRGEGLLHTMGIHEELGIPAAILLLLTAVYLLISYWYSRKSKKIGRVLFEDNMIKFITKDKEQTFDLKELDKLKIIQNTYVGEDFESSPLNNYYGDNWIYLKTRKIQLNYEFKIDSHYRTVQLRKLVDQLKIDLENFEYEQK